jgi:hypothetical protein
MAPATEKYSNTDLEAIWSFGQSKGATGAPWSDLALRVGRTDLALRLKYCKMNKVYQKTGRPFSNAASRSARGRASRSVTPAPAASPATVRAASPVTIQASSSGTTPTFRAINSWSPAFSPRSVSALAPTPALATPPTPGLAVAPFVRAQSQHDDEETVDGSAKDDDYFGFVSPVACRPSLPPVRAMVPFTELQHQASVRLHALNDQVSTLARLHFSSPELEGKERPFKDVLEAAQGLLLLSEVHGRSALRALDSGFDRIPDRRY